MDSASQSNANAATPAGSGLGKAKRKPPINPSVQSPSAVVPKTAMLTIDQTRAYELEWSDLREVVDDLKKLLPPRYLRNLSPMPEKCPSWRWNYDVESLLDALRLPRFASENTDSFPKGFAAGVNEDKFVYLLVCLKALLENGIGPHGREGDVDCALWFVENLSDGGGRSGGFRPISPDRRLVSDAILTQWSATHGAAIAEQVRAYSGSGSSASWSPRGLLRHLGYQVGQQGKHVNTRHAILTSAVLLPSTLVPQQHRANWGEAGTSTRVGEIGRMITLFRNLASGKSSANMARALREWQEDLDWLSSEYAG